VIANAPARRPRDAREVIAEIDEASGAARRGRCGWQLRGRIGRD
jgi:hypothetical protein